MLRAAAVAPGFNHSSLLSLRAVALDTPLGNAEEPDRPHDTGSQGAAQDHLPWHSVGDAVALALSAAVPVVADLIGRDHQPVVQDQHLEFLAGRSAGTRQRDGRLCAFTPGPTP